MRTLSQLTLTITSLFMLAGFFYIGPPFKSSDALKALSPEMPVMVGVTHVVLGNDAEKNDVFWDNTHAVIDSLPTHQGYLGHKVRKKFFSNEAWTMTVWTDDASLHAFVRGDVHSEAMGNGLPAVKEARFVRFTAPRSDIPLSWDAIESIMQKKGRALY